MHSNRCFRIGLGILRVFLSDLIATISLLLRLMLSKCFAEQMQACKLLSFLLRICSNTNLSIFKLLASEIFKFPNSQFLYLCLYLSPLSLDTQIYKFPSF